MKKDKQTVVFNELLNGSGNASCLTGSDNLNARFVFNNVKTGGVGTTIAKDVADYFTKSGYTVKTQGIGWVITL